VPVPCDPSRLSSRVRDLLRGQPGPAGTRDRAHELERLAAEPAVREIRLVLDEDVSLGPDTPMGNVVIERDYPPDLRHGRLTVGDCADAIERHLSSLAVLAADPSLIPVPTSRRAARFSWDDRGRPAGGERRVMAPTEGPLLFFDLETTGLSGGVGTVAFLVGCGFFDADGFHTRQFFMSGYEAETDVLAALTACVGRFGGLVTFNGRSFDVPLIDMRYAFHRIESPFERLPHFDLLHPARRLWRRRPSAPAGPEEPWSLRSREEEGEDTRCALKVLEEAILGTGRVGDVPGFEIPSRYFQYLRTGNLEPLMPVFEHNRLDLLSLAALTALAAQIAGDGPSSTPSPHEALAMGQIFERAGRDGDAEACYARAGGLTHARWTPDAIDGGIRTDALRRLALLRRRQHRFAEAADVWEAVLTSSRDRAAIQDARRALAIHHEHRTRDLGVARQLAERALVAERDPGRAEAIRHRLDRLSRKLDRPTSPIPKP
jgi:uncharacterized protein YprB with RNaseH-like and TPR domain